MNVSDFGCQILDDGLANIPCLGQLQNMIRAESLEIIYTLFRAEGPKTIPYPAARPRIAHIGEYPPPPGLKQAAGWQCDSRVFR